MSAYISHLSNRQSSAAQARGLSVPADNTSGGDAPSGWRLLLANGRAFRQAMPAWLYYYLCGLYVLLALLVAWMPVCDFDSMTSYLARIRLERLGPLRETATLEIQYLFPKFFDYLHAPVSRWGWFQTLPNFALFTAAVGAIIWRLPTAMAVRIVLGLAASSPVIVSVTSAKNDITLALLAVLFWLWIYHCNARAPWYAAVGLLLAAAMIGTKWHGLVLAAAFLALQAVEMMKAAAYTRAAALWALCAIPLAWHLSSATTYLDNRRLDGSFCPVPAYLREKVDVQRNMWAFTANSLVETFEVPFYVADTRAHGRIWAWLVRLTRGAKAWNYAIMPTPHRSVYGVAILLVIGGAAVAMFGRGTPWPIRAAALVAVAYFLFLLCRFPYSTWINRYFLTTYVMGLVPCAYLTRATVAPRWLRRALCAYLVFVSLHSVLLNQEKRLLPFAQYVAAEDRYEPSCRPLYCELFDREALQFHLWTGHLGPYRLLRANVRPCDRLLIVNGHQGNDCPFIFPFLEGRTAANTRIVNLRFGQSVPDNIGHEFDYVLVFRGTRSDPGFLPLFESPDVALYARDGKQKAEGRTNEATRLRVSSFCLLPSAFFLLPSGVQ